MHGILLGYEVRFAKDEGSTLTWISKRLGPEIHHILLDELAPNTWYWVVICARTSKGWGKEYFDLVQTWEDGEFSFWRQWKRCQDVARVSIATFEEQIKFLISPILSLPSCLNRYFDSNSFFLCFFSFLGGGLHHINCFNEIKKKQTTTAKNKTYTKQRETLNYAFIMFWVTDMGFLIFFPKYFYKVLDALIFFYHYFYLSV